MCFQRIFKFFLKKEERKKERKKRNYKPNYIRTFSKYITEQSACFEGMLEYGGIKNVGVTINFYLT